MIYLTSDDIISINKDMITSYGGIYFEGSDNIKNESSFEYMLNEPEQEIFGVIRYPYIFDKAATYLYFIIKGHIFCDGNKRTGMMAAFTFLDRNGVEISEMTSQRRIITQKRRVRLKRPFSHAALRDLFTSSRIEC